MMLPHAFDRAARWAQLWEHAGVLVVLLDFDGTLAPIVDHADTAEIPPRTRAALAALLEAPGVRAGIVSGRGLADARARVGIAGLDYAGNHGMEIEAAGMLRLHPDAVAARPALERATQQIRAVLPTVPGAWLEDKRMTLSIHYRQTPPEQVERVRSAVAGAAAAEPALRVTEGKMVLEVRPRTDWHKGRAVEFLLDQMKLPTGTLVLYVGDDRTDEDAFAALARRVGVCGEGIVVGDPPRPDTDARSYLRSPAEVGELFERLIEERA